MLVQVPRSDPIRHDVQKMPLRKGSLLIWHSAIPHGTFPNDSNRFRLIQYMKMAPASYPHILPFYQSDSAFRPMYPFPEDVVLTELGKKIYGLKPWKPEEEKSRCVLM
jgi:ectoine hydroxylase-related dioxygenase (phytanoyl-CoA dioxygenase family)